jgi:hypothetical protein
MGRHSSAIARGDGVEARRRVAPVVAALRLSAAAPGAYARRVVYRDFMPRPALRDLA